MSDAKLNREQLWASFRLGEPKDLDGGPPVDCAALRALYRNELSEEDARFLDEHIVTWKSWREC